VRADDCFGDERQTWAQAAQRRLDLPEVLDRGSRGSTDSGFTMSTVPVSLDIGFYGGSGAPVSTRHMVPCPDVEARCPAYRASGPFSYAIETPRGSLPSGALGVCS